MQQSSKFFIVLLCVLLCRIMKCSEGIFLWEGNFSKSDSSQVEYEHSVIRPRYACASNSDICPGDTDELLSTRHYTLNQKGLVTAGFSKKSLIQERIFLVKNNENGGILFRKDTSNKQKDFIPFAAIDIFTFQCIKKALETKKNDSSLCFKLFESELNQDDRIRNRLFILNEPIIDDQDNFKKKTSLGRYFFTYDDDKKHRNDNPFLCTIDFRSYNNQIRAYLIEQSRLTYYMQNIVFGGLCVGILALLVYNKLHYVLISR